MHEKEIFKAAKWGCTAGKYFANKFWSLHMKDEESEGL